MKTLFVAALVASTMAAFGAASAMTSAPIAPAANADVIQVAGGCGPGFHPGPHGQECFPNRGEPVVVVRPRACPPGMGMTRFGCRRI